MNKVFKRIWNAARGCWVVVSEAAGVGQTRGCGKKTVVASAVCLHIDADIKRLVVSALAWAVCSCFALPTHASWITDHGGVKNELTWTVGTDGTTTWKPLENQEFEILKGETLIVGSKGSNYSEASVSAIPNMTAGNRITNRGTYKINWTGNKIQANAENEGNFIDNYGTVAIVMNQTPNFGSENILPNGMLNHNMAAWEIYRWNLNGVDAAWLKEKPAFYNRQGAEFIIDVNVDSSKLTSDKDATKFGSSITGISINGSGDRAGMAGKNAGHIKVDIENAGSKTYGLYLRQKGNAFTNEKTGVFDIGTTYKKPADNFLDPTLLPYAVGIKLGSSAELRNEGTFNIDVAGNRAYGISIGDSTSSTSHLVNAAGGTFALKTKANSKNAKDYAILFDVETDAIIDNYGTMTGTATALGTQAQGIGFYNAGGRFNNYAGAKLYLTAMAQATNESAVKVFAKGIYLNGMEQFVNNGSATLSAIVDGAGTDKVTNGWAIDARDANTQVVNNKELNLNYTGALGGGVNLIKGATFSNNATATITVNRPVNEVVRTGLTGIRALNTSTITNAGNLSISMTGVAPTTAPNEYRNQGGDMTGLYVAGTDDSIISLSNKKNSKLDINVNVSNAAEGQTNGIRPYGMILTAHAKNEGTMDVTVTGNYGKVPSDYGVFAAMGFNIDGENASKETALAHPRIENSGLMKANVSFNAQGMTPTLDPAKAKGWATGLNMHGTATLVNSGTLQSKATSTVNAKAASIQGSELINNKDAAFEAEATGNGSFAAALQVGRPNADMVEIPSYVLNDVNGTLTLTAKSPIGSSYGIYESAGKVENKGMLTVTAEGRDANGISLSNEDLERRDGSNPEFNNSGTLTVHANALETVPTMYHEAQALLLKTGSFVNSGTLDAFATASGLAEGMKISDAIFTNQKGGILNLTVKSNQTVWQDGLAGGISIAPNSNVVNAGTINIDMESHAHFIKGFSFGDKSSTLTNTGTIKILGTNFGDGTHVKEPTLKDTKNAYGMYLNGGEKFANDGTLIIGVNALKGVSMGIAAHDAEIANNAGGKMNITVKAYEQEAFGIDVYGASGCGNNAGTISFDATAGTTDNALARVIFLRNGGFFANTGTLDFKLRGTTDSASNADVMAADITGANTKFNNQGLVEISGNRTSAGASGDVLGLRVNNGATLDNTETGSIDIALGPTGNHKYANNFGISVFDKAAFGNAGTVGIALNQEAGNLGTLYGLKLGADAVVNNSATGTIKIDVSPEAVGSSHAWAIHGDSAMIKNYGLIETNGAISLGSILGTASNANGGILKLTGKDAVSTVTGQLCLGTIENAGKLTVGSVYSKTGTDVSLKAYDLLNTGTLNTDSGWFMNSVINDGIFNVISETNKAEEAFDAVLANDGTFINRNQLTFNVLSHESTRQLYAGHGKLHNEGTFEATVTNAGRGDVVGFIRDWDDKPAQYTLSVRNEKTMNLTLKASNGSADLFAMLGKERFVNGASGVVRANVSAGTSANGWMLSDTTSFENGNELNLTLTGLKSTSKLIGLSSLNAGAVATNGGSLNLKLTGKGAEAYGLKSSIAEALFTNNGTLSIESTGTFGKVSAIDWAGKIANTGTIKTELGVKLGSLTNTGRVSTADMMVTGSIQNDRNAVMQIGTLKTKDGKTKIRNDGTLSISNAENRVTVQNTGVLAIGSFKNVSVQNKGTLKTGELKVGAADQLVNGGTILAEKITVDGLLQNRNGTFALGTAAVAKYLEKHLDLAQQLKDLGETLPTSVEALLSAQADAEVASLTTLELADGERSVESDDEMSETTESTDFASLFATVQAANTPQGRLATREGRLAFARFSTYADNRAQLERQLQSGLSGLWADVIASQSEMDGYKANRSGIAVGLQGTNDAGLTFGVAARYSDGKLKGDALTSENWTSAGGSTYAAWTNEDAFVSGFIGYDNLKTKGSDKFTNDVVSVGVKSGLKLAVGPVHVTPFVGGEVVHQKVKGLDAATTYRFPVGVGLAGQHETYGAWQVHPSLEVAFVPQAGDKVIDVTDKVDSRFTGNYAVESRLGIAVEKKNLMLGINYHGSAGDAGLRSHSLQANVRYRF